MHLSNMSGTDRPARTCTGDTAPFCSRCKTRRVCATRPWGGVAVNCYSQWEIKDCGKESPRESQTWYKAVLHHECIRLTNYAGRVLDCSESLVSAGEFGSDYTEDKMWNNGKAWAKPGQSLPVRPASAPGVSFPKPSEGCCALRRGCGVLLVRWLVCSAAISPWLWLATLNEPPVCLGLASWIVSI